MTKTQQAALLLIGHGSSRYPEAVRPVLDLAAALRATGNFGDVATAFIKNAPTPEHVFPSLQAEAIVVVPVFAGKGWYTDVYIPQKLGLTGPVTHREGRTIVQTPPVGSHQRMPGVLAARAHAVASSAGLNPKEVSLLLIAHGSSRTGGSGETPAGETPRAIAQEIRSLDDFHDVQLVFIEQEPRITQWPNLVAKGDVIVLQLLVAQGAHAAEDIAPLFGLTPGQCGPINCEGRAVRLAPGLGAEPELADIIIDMAKEALKDR